MVEYDFKHNIYVLTYLPTGKKYVGKTGYNDGGKVRPLETALDTIIEVDSRFQNLMVKIET